MKNYKTVVMLALAFAAVIFIAGCSSGKDATVPSAFRGVWVNNADNSDVIEFTSTKIIFYSSSTYSIAGTTLTLENMGDYARVEGSGSTLVGTWMYTETDWYDAVKFTSKGKFEWDWNGEATDKGVWSTAGSILTLGFAYPCTVKETIMTVTMYGTPADVPYTLSGNQLTVGTAPDDETYTKQ